VAEHMIDSFGRGSLHISNERLYDKNE